ncbi:hypothetical protein lerEdw1_020553 [Lerista edwardsae]|nr:hypothetical protein lerEdw1_020553 [Lerista edwardsae]
MFSVPCQVRLQFSAKQALPASNVSLHIRAAANSHCALRAVDQSILLLRPGRELSAESVRALTGPSPIVLCVYSLLPFEMYGYYFNGLNLEDTPQEPCISPENIFYNGLYYIPSSSYYGPDIYGSIRATDEAATTTLLPPPPPPGEASRDKAMIETVRKFFPETWIWDLVPTESCLFLPWESGVACVCCYYVIFSSGQVRISLAQSQDFQAQLLSPVNDNGCVCGGERKTYVWKIITKKLGDVTFSITAEAPRNGGACGNGSSGGLDVGRKDTLIRTLLVEPEGVEREATQSSLICTKDAAVSERVSLKLPENLVEGSARAFFSCIDNKFALSAYIAIVLLESSPAQRTSVNSDPVIRNALFCLEAGLENENISIYDQALMAYAFSLAGDQAKLDVLLDMLYKSAIKEGESLICRCTKPNPTSEEMTTASQMVQWIARQQNAYGGFSSTQDTVTAIQALAKYSQLTFSKDGQNTVKIHSSRPFEKVFQVDHSNRLLLQRTSLPDVPGDYTVDVSGSGCVFVQATLRYNIILPHKSSGFSLSVQTANASCSDNVQTKFTIVIAASYTGKRNHSNMAIVDVKMLTGFVPDQSSLQKLRDSNIVMKVETKQNHVLCYLDNLSFKETTFSFVVVQDLPVSNLRPAPVRLYDYYETDENSVAEYKFPCNTRSS